MLTAYIDPSSMTYLIQIIAGVVIAAGAGVGFYWKRIRRSIQRKKDEKAAAAAGTVPVQPQETTAGETFTADMLHAQNESKEQH